MVSCLLDYCSLLVLRSLHRLPRTGTIREEDGGFRVPESSDGWTKDGDAEGSMYVGP